MQTIPLGHLLELNLAEAGQIYPWFPPIFGGLHLSVGASIGGDIRWWAFRPEVGVLLHPDEERVITFSLGLAFLTPPSDSTDVP